MLGIDEMDAFANRHSAWLAQQDAWGNSVLRWGIAVAVAALLFFVLLLIRSLAARHANRLAEKAASDWFHGIETLLRRTARWFLLILAVYGGSGLLALPEAAARLATLSAVVALVLQGALWGDALLMYAMGRYTEQRKEVDAASVTTLTALGFVGRLAIWVAAALLTAANLGIDVTAMIAGLGIGGIAVALAAQNILGDLFASASIVLDKPFVLGDFIVVDNKMGSVEYIGLKTTRLRSLSGEQLVFSNTDLLKSRIHNYKRMSERRAAFSLDIAYDTPYEKLQAIPELLRDLVKNQPATRFDRAHFAKFGETALTFDVVYYVTGADYTKYMDVQQAINLSIVRTFAERGIRFAFPAWLQAGAPVFRRHS